VPDGTKITIEAAPPGEGEGEKNAADKDKGEKSGPVAGDKTGASSPAKEKE
jgi:hypothetical protein